MTTQLEGVHLPMDLIAIHPPTLGCGRRKPMEMGCQRTMHDKITISSVKFYAWELQVLSEQRDIIICQARVKTQVQILWLDLDLESNPHD